MVVKLILVSASLAISSRKLFISFRLWSSFGVDWSDSEVKDEVDCDFTVT